MSILKFANLARTTIAAPITAGATTVTLAPGSGALFPSLTAGFTFVATFVDFATKTINEIVLVTAISTDTVTITRAQEGTTALAWLTGDYFSILDTAGTMNALVQAAQLQGGTYSYAVAGGTANAITATIASTLSAIPDGMPLVINASAANTGATTLVLTLGSTTLASASIVRGNGETLSTGDIPFAGFDISLIWNAGKNAYILQNQFQIVNGQVIFKYTSPTVCTLFPRNGNMLTVGGTAHAVGSTGVTLSNGGLAASTAYYVYAYISGASIALEASTTGHGAGPNGIEIKNGDSTRSLVGQVITNGSSQFIAPTNNVIGVLSWFNRKTNGLQPNAVSGSLTTTTPLEINSGARISFICWSDDCVDVNAYGFGDNSISGDAVVLGIGINSTTVATGQVMQANVPFIGAAVGLSATLRPTLSELTSYYITPLGYSSGGTSNFNVSSSIVIRG